MTNNLDPDQTRRFVGSDLGTNGLKMTLTGDKLINLCGIGTVLPWC